MRAWRWVGGATLPLAEEGAAAASLWEAGASAVWVDGDDLVGFFGDHGEGTPPGDGRWEEIPDVDHVGAYLASLGPVDAGTLVVAPTHREVTLRPGQQVVWLDPGMAFGSGHHETTRMVLEALSELPLVGRRVLDVGAGSGVLAIAADRLGAADACGIDVDPATLPVARANAVRNNSRARFWEGGFGTAPLPGPFDVVLANLTAELHVASLVGYAAVTTPGADLLLSGILEPRDTLVRAALAEQPAEGTRFSLVAARRDGDWWLLHLRRER